MAKFALIPWQTIIQEQTLRVEAEIEPKPTRGRVEQVISTHQRLIDLAIDSVQDDAHWYARLGTRR